MVFFVSSSYIEPPSEFVFFMELFQDIDFIWIIMLLYAQQYFLHNSYRCSHNA